MPKRFRRRFRKRRTFRKRRFRKRSVIKKKTWDGQYKAKCELSGTFTGTATGFTAIYISWGTNGGVLGLTQPTAAAEYTAFASRFREYKLVGFTLEVNFITR